MHQSEKLLTTTTVKYLNSLDGVFAIRIVPSPLTSMRGMSDILCCYHGKFIAIELKVGKNKPTRLQEKFLSDVKNKGLGYSFVCWSINDVKKCLSRVANDESD